MWAAVALLALTAIGFLVAALYQTYLALSDPIVASLLVAATLAAAAGLVVVAMWLAQPRAADGESAHDTDQGDGQGDVLSFLSEMESSISSERLPPLTAVGLALSAGLSRGMRE